MREVWKSAFRYEGYYEVSNLGRVKRVKEGRGARAGHVLQSFPNANGYLQLRLFREGKAKTERVAILIAETFISENRNGLDVNHINGDKTDNRLANLEYVTRSENICHAYQRLNRVRAMAKISEDTVREIRKRFANGERRRVLANEFGLHLNTITLITRRKLWAHVV